MRITVLTSSRADYGIYLPLLKKLQADEFFDLNIVAFGTHLSTVHGHTLDQITEDGFKDLRTVETVMYSDKPRDITLSMAKTMEGFSKVWAEESGKTDLIICLGDRYEMFAAVSSSVPFNIPVAHFHGGETTTGAIDDKFRHCITMMSSFHFASTEVYARRITEMRGSSDNVYTVGALSLDNLDTTRLLSIEEFREKYGINLQEPTILVTCHPETVAFEKAGEHVKELVKAIKACGMQTLITMPNADTYGNLFRSQLEKLVQEEPAVYGVESLGTQGYFSAMKHCSFMLGNTSSGIIEAASLGTYVIDLGSRQNGRATSRNVIKAKFDSEEILQSINKVRALPAFTGENIYWKKNVADQVIAILKNYYERRK